MVRTIWQDAREQVRSAEMFRDSPPDHGSSAPFVNTILLKRSPSMRLPGKPTLAQSGRVVTPGCASNLENSSTPTESQDKRSQ